MRRFLAIALLPIAGCTAMVGAFSRPENVECHDYAYTALVDLAAASLIGALSYTEDGGTAGYVATGVFGASALGGFTGSIVCDARRESRATAAVYYPRGSSEPPESLRLDPNGDVRDATPEEMGLGKKPVSTDLTVHSDAGPPDAAPPNRDGSSTPTVQPPVPPPPSCQLSPRIDCPQKTHCVLTEENRGVCEAIP
ncbi:MAG TPA: hypothetical protein VGM90_00210 [Kofleriaceae bacterium]|jgi:hypothetical protein